MRRFDRDLETIARFQYAGRLTLYGKLETALQDVARFDSRMRVPRKRHSRVYFHFHVYRHIARHWAVHLRENFSLDAWRQYERRALRRRLGGNEPCNRTDRAGSKTRKASSCQHGSLPFMSGSLASELLEHK